jgi:hypothetical protein
MKKFSEWIGTIREAEKAQQSELQQSYQDYFMAKLAKYGVESPADLDDEKKKDFFNEISADWEKGKGAKPAGEKDIEKHGVKESEELKESHFKEGDRVKCKESGMTGEVIQLDKEDGADDEKYYTVKTEDGEVGKYSPNELELVEEEKKADQ